MHARRVWKAFPSLAVAALAALPALGCQAAPAPASLEAVDEGRANDGFDDFGNGLVVRASTKASLAPEPSPPREPGAQAAQEHAPERMLIERAELKLAVSSPEEASKLAARVAKELGGYAQSASYQTVVLRVPAPRFEEALERFAKLGRVLARSVTAQDVTEEVVDLRLRLKNALALRDRLAALLDKADKVEDVLKIEAELTRVRVEVEQLEGKLKALEHAVALATITLQLVQSTAAPRGERLPFSWLKELGLGSVLGGR